MMDPSAVSGSGTSMENDIGVATGQKRLAPVADGNSNGGPQAAADSGRSERFSESLNKARANTSDDLPPDKNMRATEAQVADASARAEKTTHTPDDEANAAVVAEAADKPLAEENNSTGTQIDVEGLAVLNEEALAAADGESLSIEPGTPGAVVSGDGEQQVLTDAEQLLVTTPGESQDLESAQGLPDTGDGGSIAAAVTGSQINSQQAATGTTPVEVPDAGDLPVLTNQVSLADQATQLFRRADPLKPTDEQTQMSAAMRSGADAANAMLLKPRETTPPPVPVMDEAVLEEALESIKDNVGTKVVTARVERSAEIEAAMQANVAANATVAKTPLSLVSAGAGVPLSISPSAADQPLDGLTARTTALSSSNPAAPGAASRELPAVPAFAGDNIRLMLQQGLSRATLMLHPAELGALKISLEVQSDQLNVQIAATQSATRDVLEQALPKMRAHLQQGGFGGVNIDLSNGQTSSQQQQSEQAFQFRNGGSSASVLHADGMPGQMSINDSTGMPVTPVAVRLVDLFA